MTAPIVIVTGANSGIGRAASEQLAARGAEVIMACRSVERGADARDAIAAKVDGANLHVMELDVGSFASVRHFAAQVMEQLTRVNVLINNAAIFDLAQTRAIPTDDGIERVWATNFVGPALLTELLLPALRASDPPSRGRIIDISSKGLLAHPFLNVDEHAAETGAAFSADRAYYQSKLAMLTHTLYLARRETDVVAHGIWVPAVKVALDRLPPLSPFKRWVYMLKRNAALEPEEMAKTYVAAALDPYWAEVTGRLIDHRQAEVRPPKKALNRDVAERLAAYLREIASRSAQQLDH